MSVTGKGDGTRVFCMVIGVGGYCFLFSADWRIGCGVALVLFSHSVGDYIREHLR